MVQKPPSKFEEFMRATGPSAFGCLAGARDVIVDSLRNQFVFGPKFYPDRADEMRAAARAKALDFRLGILDDGTIYDLPDLPIIEPFAAP